jgi:hypothetical protein
MRTYEDIKKNRLLSENNRLNVARKRLNTSVGVARIIRQKEQIDYSLSVLENIDETIKMEISYNANLLFDLISNETEYTIFIKMFYSRILEYIRYIQKGVEESDKFDKKIVDLIKYFDFSKDDILKLVEFGSIDSLKNDFIRFINNSYGTDIPMESEWIVIDDETRDLFSEEELANLDIYDIYLQFRNGDFMINKFNSMYPMLYTKDMIEYFGRELFNGESKSLRRM